MKHFLLMALLWLAAATAWANTRFGFGTITGLDPEGKQNKGAPAFQVLFEARNLVDGRELDSAWYRLTEKTRHGDRVYLLDGKPSTAQEALLVGRAVTVSDNDMVIHVSSKVKGPEAADGKKEPANALHVVTAGPMQFLVDVADGKVLGAVAIPPRDAPEPSLAADASGLKLQNDQLSGVIRGATFTNELGGKLTTKLLNRPARPEPTQVWLRLQVVEALGSTHTYTVMALGQKGGLLLHKKGHVQGEITAQNLALADGKLTGSFTVTLPSGPVTLTVDGIVLANRVLAGQFTSDKGWGGRFRGGLTDADGPQLRGCTAEQTATVKQIQGAKAAPSP